MVPAEGFRNRFRRNFREETSALCPKLFFINSEQRVLCVTVASAQLNRDARNIVVDSRMQFSAEV